MCLCGRCAGKGCPGQVNFFILINEPTNRSTFFLILLLFFYFSPFGPAEKLERDDSIWGFLLFFFFFFGA